MTKETELVTAEIADPQEPEVAAILSELIKQSEEQLIALLKSDGKRAKTLRKITQEVASYPYGETGRALFSKDKDNDINNYLDVTNVYNASSPEVKAQAEELTDGGIARMFAIIQQAYPDAQAIAKAMEAGKFKTLEGKRWPKDSYGLADLSAFTPTYPVSAVNKNELEGFTIARERVNVQGLQLRKDAETSAHVIGIPKDGGEAVVIPYGALMGVWAAFVFLTRLDLEGYGEQIRAVLSGDRKERRAPLKNESVLITNTKAENSMFNPRDKDYFRADEYNGQAKIIKTGNKNGEATIQLSLQLDFVTFDFDKMTMAEKAERQLTEEDRFWLRGLQSIAHENPDQTRIYGSDILKRWGWQNPYQKSSETVLGEVAASLERMRVVTVILDTTGEQRAYEKRGKLIKSIQPRPIVDGLITLEEYETPGGKRIRDFYIDLRPLNGADATDALPTLGYALEKGQLITAPREVFVFDTVKDEKTGKVIAPSVSQVNKNHRRMMAYIYGQIMSKGLSNTIHYSTMFETLGLELTKDTKSRASKKLGELLDHWRARGIIENWNCVYSGKKNIGLVIVPPKKRLSGSRTPKK